MESFISDDHFIIRKQKLKDIATDHQDNIHKMKWKISLIYDVVAYFEKMMKIHK